MAKAYLYIYMYVYMYVHVWACELLAVGGCFIYIFVLIPY